jgi:hypothetical protein
MGELESIHKRQLRLICSLVGGPAEEDVSLSAQSARARKLRELAEIEGPKREPARRRWSPRELAGEFR